MLTWMTQSTGDAEGGEDLNHALSRQNGQSEARKGFTETIHFDATSARFSTGATDTADGSLSLEWGKV